MSNPDSTIPERPSKKVPYVYLGKSGLKVSKVILGCMAYGGGEWMGWQWLFASEQAIEHIKYAFILSKAIKRAPIIGTTNLHNLKDIAEGLDLKLTEDEIRYLEELADP